MENNVYIAVVGDVIGSKSITDRSGAQEILRRTLTEVNTKYGDWIAANFIITLGDEFQGLLYRNSRFWDIMEYIRWQVHPVRIRFAVGKGEIVTTIDRSQAIGADGPAFHRARAIIDRLRKEENAIYSTRPTMLYSSNSKDDILVNEILRFCSFLESRWTARQRDIIRLTRVEGKKQADTASQLGIEQSTVSRALKASGYLLYDSGMRSLREYFQTGLQESGQKGGQESVQ